MNSDDELWNQIQKFIDGIYLSDLITEDAENVSISIKDCDNKLLKLPVKKLNDLWVSISKTTKVPAGFLHYLNTKLSALKDEEKSELTILCAETLSAKMNGLHLKVDISDSLTEMLLAVIADDTGNLTNTTFGKGNHTLSVLVQIPELESRYVKADCLGLLQPTQLIPAVDPKWYHKTNQFSVKLNFSETVFEGTVKDSQAIVALAIVLTCYPERWRKVFFWDAWLTIVIQLCLSADLEPEKITFPCMWMKHIFDAERLVSPEDVQYLLFGKDPLNKTCITDLNRLCKATGIAFHAIGNDEPSVGGMKTLYGLDCDGDNPMKYCHDGLLMVNLIRCIGEEDESLSKNSYRSAWIAYTLKIIHHFSSKNKPVIVLTTATSILPEIYVPAVCNGDLVRAPHPTAPKDTTPDHQQNINKVRQYLSGYNRSNQRQSIHVQKPSSVCVIL